MSGKLPRGWAPAKIGDVTITKVEQGEPGGPGSFDYIDIGSIDNRAKRIREVKRLPSTKAPSRARQLVATNDVLVSMTRPNLNAVALVSPEFERAIASTGFDVLRSNGAVAPDWLFLHVRSRQFVECMTYLVQGALYPAVRSTDIRDYEFALPPLAEQRRIVARLEKLEARSRRARAALDAIPPLLAQTRQSLLAAAFRGKMTADWRKANRKSPKHRESSPTPDTELSRPLPKGWLATQLRNVVPREGLFDGPFGSHLKSDDYTEHGVRVVRLENIGHLTFDDEKRTFIGEEKYKLLQRHTVSKGDIIFSSFIFDPPRACLLPALDTLAIAKADCFCIRPDTKLVDRNYICYQLASPSFGHELKDMIHGVTRPRVNTTQLREAPIAWCPLAEQREIVRRLDRALARLDATAAAHAAAVAELARLDQSLLAQAFSGKLVKQDPADEPAEALLARIRA